jgi:hypothetical protein
MAHGKIDGKYQTPSSCEGKCKSRVFEPDRANAQTVDFQRIRFVIDIVGLRDESSDRVTIVL